VVSIMPPSAVNDLASNLNETSMHLSISVNRRRIYGSWKSMEVIIL
jgi:hypothetical protein